MTSIAARMISAEGFAPFGTLFPAKPETRRDFIDEIANLRSTARPRLTLVTAPGVTLPFNAVEMERHEFSGQAFVPVDVARYLVLVAPPTAGVPDPSTILAFIVPGDCGIIYGAGIWHHPMRSLDRPGSFASLTFVDGSSGDEEFRPLAERLAVA